MRSTKIILSMTFAVMLIAEKASADVILPIQAGKWGISIGKKIDCMNLEGPIEITSTIITYYMSGGKGVCKIISLKRGKNYYNGKTAPCKWDKSVPDAVKISPDGDDNSFSIKLTKNPNEILFNNTEYALCEAQK